MTPIPSQKCPQFEIFRVLKTWISFGGHIYWVKWKVELGLVRLRFLLTHHFYPTLFDSSPTLTLTHTYHLTLTLTIFIDSLLLQDLILFSNPNPSFWFVLTQNLWPPYHLKSVHNLRFSEYWKLEYHLGVINIESNER